MKIPSSIEIETLETRFRLAPASTNLNHVEDYNLIASIGGESAIAYGIWIATPFRQRWKKAERGLAVADALKRARE